VQRPYTERTGHIASQSVRRAAFPAGHRPSERPGLGPTHSGARCVLMSGDNAPRPRGGPVDPGFRLDGRYRLERRTGRHGQAEVWRAHDELLARPVAVTLASVPRAHRDLRRRLRDAARAAAALDHPGIVTTYDFGEAEDTGGDALVYAVTEFLTGESLAARLSR